LLFSYNFLLFSYNFLLFLFDFVGAFGGFEHISVKKRMIGNVKTHG